jgi:hypothetical protein
MKLRLGLGFSNPVGGAGGTPPTLITLSNDTVPEDLAAGLDVGTLSNNGTLPGTYSIVADPDNKFAINAAGDGLATDAALDFETAEDHDVTVRFTWDGGTIDQPFAIDVTDVDETTEPPIDPETVTPVFSGGFDVNPVFGKGNGKGKGQGKANALATVVFSIGAVEAGTTYIMHYVADLSLLSNQGKNTFVGFIMKDGNNFHGVGLKGDGTVSGEDPTTIQGNWNALGSVTITDKGTEANGDQYEGLVRIAFSEDGSTYTFSTGTGDDPETAVWTEEVVDQAVSNITDLTTAETFGPAMFIPGTDIGQFSIEIDVWEVVTPQPDFITARYWRLNAVTFNVFPSVAEFQVGMLGQAPHTPVAFLSSSNNGELGGGTGGAAAGRVADGDPTTAWYPSSGSAGQWVGLDFGAPVDVSVFRMTGRSGSQWMTEADLEYSSDGSSWSFAWTGENMAAQDSGSWWLHNVRPNPGATPDGKVLWRFYVTEAADAGSTMQYATLELRDSIGGANLATDTAMFNGQWNDSSHRAQLAVDGNAGTYYSCNGVAGISGPFAHYEFDYDTDIVQIAIKARSDDASKAPKAFSLWHSGDGVNWTQVGSWSGQTGWSNGETRTFNV